MPPTSTSSRVPVVILTGHLGSGKTTLLNHLLRQPGARVGVVVNDFGDINVDAGLVTGQIDEPASIAGGCLCCLPDAGGLDDALEKLTHPRLALDVVIVEASGIAEPGTLAKLVRFSGVERVRRGGLIEVVDASAYFDTLDDGRGPAPVRFAAASLVVINKTDLVPAAERDEVLARIERRVREHNPEVHIAYAVGGRIDPRLVYDAAVPEDPPDELPIAALLRVAAASHEAHQHARAVTVTTPGTIEPARLVDLLEEPPATAYRVKGTVAVATGQGPRSYHVNLVGRSAHVAAARRSQDATSELVAIGLELEADSVRVDLTDALAPAERPSTEGLRRLRQLVRVSL
ncbi:GTP-binding protein [Nocardioides sp. NPDC000445]|uniref:CobW family GTP-binding protein n=1 Tax=Nocardioides sp. NPDC000445 TaxID=3154257 RepID=UPI00331BAEDC